MKSKPKKRKTAIKKTAKKVTKKKKTSAKTKVPKYIAKDLKKWAFQIFDVLSSEGLRPVLVGNSCSAIYAPSDLHPKNIDFVINRTTMPKLKRLLSTIGFKSKELRHFKNSKCPFDLVICPPPLAVGDELISEVDTIKEGRRSLDLLGPTDCIRHRLAHFYRWGDDDALEAAVAVAKRRRKIDFEIIRRWSEWEWADDKYAEFIAKVGGKSGS